MSNVNQPEKVDLTIETRLDSEIKASTDATAQTLKINIFEPQTVAFVVPIKVHPIFCMYVIRKYSAYASWYKQGKITASGEIYNPMGLTVAHKSLPFNTMIKFTNLNTGKSVIARVNDRGPYVRGREYDLSMGTARLLGFTERGVVKLEVEILKFSEVQNAKTQGKSEQVGHQLKRS